MDETGPVDTTEVTFELDTEDPRNVVLTIMCDEPLDGDDLINALEEMLSVVKNAQIKEASGH